MYHHSLLAYLLFLFLFSFVPPFLSSAYLFLLLFFYTKISTCFIYIDFFQQCSVYFTVFLPHFPPSPPPLNMSWAALALTNVPSPFRASPCPTTLMVLYSARMLLPREERKKRVSMLLPPLVRRWWLCALHSLRFHLTNVHLSPVVCSFLPSILFILLSSSLLLFPFLFTFWFHALKLQASTLCCPTVCRRPDLTARATQLTSRWEIHSSSLSYIQ